METRANYILIGSFVLVLMAGLLIFVVWLGKFQFDRDFARYDIYFSRSVSGLKVGSPVSYRGINVGEVVDIRIAPEDVERILVTVEIDAETPIRTDTVARLAIEGLAGGTYVLLEGGTQAAEPLATPADRRRPVIPSQPSPIESVIEGMPQLLDRLTALADNASQLLNSDNQVVVSETLTAIRDIAVALSGQTDTLTAAVRNAAQASENLKQMSQDWRATSAQLRGDLGQLTKRVDATLAAIEKAANSVNGSADGGTGGIKAAVGELAKAGRALGRMAEEIGQLVAENRDALHDFSNNGLYGTDRPACRSTQSGQRPQSGDDRGRARPDPFHIWWTAAWL